MRDVMTRPGVGAIMAVLIVSTLLVGAVATVSAQNRTQNSTNATSASTVEREPVSDLSDKGVALTLDELRRGGQTLDGNPASVRVDSSRMWWLEHWPASAVMADVGSMEDTSSQFVSRGETVDRNSVFIRTTSLSSVENAKTLRIVYWRDGVQERTTGDGTVIEEPAARDVVVDEHRIDLQAGMNIIDIPLRQSDEPRQVSMWFTDDPDVRWTFEHESVATTSPAGIDTEGDYIWSVVTQFLVPISVGTALTGGVARKAIGRTGLGPGYSILSWMVGIALVTGFVVMSQFSSVAQLINAAPILLAAVVVAIVGIVVLESQAVRDREVAFIQPTTKDVDGPKGEGAQDSLIASARVETVVDMPDGTPAIVRRGILPFLARYFGKAAAVPSMAFETRIKTPTGPWSELIVVDPDAPTVLDYAPEGFEYEPPSNSDEWMRAGVVGIAIAGGVYAIGTWLSWGWAMALGALAVGVLVMSPTDGHADVWPASAHTRSAWISTLTLAQEVDDAHTLDQARETLVERQSKTQQEIQSVVEEQDSTLIESALGMDLDRSVESDESEESPDMDAMLERIDKIETDGGSSDREEDDDER